MSVYRYRSGSLIERIEMHAPRLGVAQATITAAAGADAAQLAQLRHHLAAEHFSTLIDTVEGRPVLQVRGLHSEESLLRALRKYGYAAGLASVDGPKKHVDFRDRVRGKSLFLSAIFYDLGNAAFFASGIQRARHNEDGKFTRHDVSEFMTGAAFTAGDLLLTAYGRDRGDEELQAAANGLKKHLHRQGIALPEGDALNPDTVHQTGALKSIDRWLKRHIVQVKCLSELAGGLFTIHAALKPNNRNTGKLVAGMLISTGWLTTLLLEKPRGDEILAGNKPPPSSLAEHLAADPRGLIARPLAMANNVSNLWGSLNPKTGERARFQNCIREAQDAVRGSDTPENRAKLSRAQACQHDFIWNVISACSFLVAHTLFGLSGEKPPTQTEDDKRVMEDLVLLSANVLAKQPEAVREQAIAQTADYVSRLAHVTKTPDALAQDIRGKIDALSHSAWTQRVQAPATTPRHL